MAPVLTLGAPASQNAQFLYGWGQNSVGELGDGTTTQRNSPVQIGKNSFWTWIGGTQGRSTGIRSNRAFSWGINPSEVSGSNVGWTRIVTAFATSTGFNNPPNTWTTDYNLGIREGKLFAWGTNATGELGDGTTTYRSSPTQIGSDTDWQEVTAFASSAFGGGAGTSYGLKGGKVYRWGTASGGASSPTQLGTDSDWTFLATKVSSSGGSLLSATQYAIRAGRLYTLNVNDVSQQGSDTDWSKASAGINHVLAIKTNGALYAQGDNTYGQLGDGTTTTRNSFVQIGSDTDWEWVAAGTFYSLAVKGKKLYAWGQNSVGELGDGTTTQRNSPVEINSTGKWSRVFAAIGSSWAIR